MSEFAFGHSHHRHRVRRSKSRSSILRFSDIMPHPVQVAIQQLALPLPMEQLAQGYEGFEELRKFIKHGNEFSKEVAGILQERAELESTYAKSLNKLAGKLLKAVTSGVGSLTNGWKAVGTAMEEEAELHKNLAAGLLDEMSKPLKGLAEAQAKARRPIEETVNKSYKNLQDKRIEEFKSKKKSYTCCRKAEECLGTTKSKDVSRWEKQCKQLSSAAKKADKEYTENCYNAESARQDWEYTVAKAGSQLQQIEEERLRGMQEYLNKYNSHISVLAPKLTQAHDRLNEAVISVDLQQDIQTAIVQKRVQGPKQAEQILVDCPAEDTQITMDKERRKENLKNFLIYIHQLIEKEQKGKDGVQKLVEVYKSKPKFADPEAQEDTQQRLNNIMLMLNFLEASHFKINCCLCKLEGRRLPQHPFEQYISSSRDRQNFVVSTLKLPMQIALNTNAEYNDYSLTNEYYMELQGPDDDFDEDFDDLPSPVGKCKALYEYVAKQGDELSIHKGDVIVVYEKLKDGWWQGEVNGRNGIFPSTYVEEIP